MKLWMGLSGHKWGNMECVLRIEFLFTVMCVDSFVKVHVYCLRPWPVTDSLAFPSLSKTAEQR